MTTGGRVLGQSAIPLIWSMVLPARHIITETLRIESETNYNNFNSSYLHRWHCMGLPDYYLYNSDDFEGMKKAMLEQN